MKRFVTAVGYFFLAFALIFLEQLPTVFIRANQPFNQTLGITLALLVVSIFTIYVARRVGFLKQLEDLKNLAGLENHSYWLYGLDGCQIYWWCHFGFGKRP